MVETIFQRQLSPKEDPFASSQVWMLASFSDGGDARDLMACPSISLLLAGEHPPTDPSSGVVVNLLLAFESESKTIGPFPMAWSH